MPIFYHVWASRKHDRVFCKWFVTPDLTIWLFEKQVRLSLCALWWMKYGSFTREKKLETQTCHFQWWSDRHFYNSPLLALLPAFYPSITHEAVRVHHFLCYDTSTTTPQHNNKPNPYPLTNSTHTNTVCFFVHSHTLPCKLHTNLTIIIVMQFFLLCLRVLWHDHTTTMTTTTRKIVIQPFYHCYSHYRHHLHSTKAQLTTTSSNKE